MHPARNPTTRFSIEVKSKPGQLAKLTKYLSDSGLNVDGLAVSSFGDRAEIRFSAPLSSGLPEGLRKSGLRALPE
ncbi:MAG: ACT domain-containing protein [Elusimicrobia bacterium]|nr:ACT domain-containing protein [Elusimicrobiota bacterium]